MSNCNSASLIYATPEAQLFLIRVRRKNRGIVEDVRVVLNKEPEFTLERAGLGWDGEFIRRTRDNELLGLIKDGYLDSACSSEWFYFNKLDLKPIRTTTESDNPHLPHKSTRLPLFTTYSKCLAAIPRVEIRSRKGENEEEQEVQEVIAQVQDRQSLEDDDNDDVMAVSDDDLVMIAESSSSPSPPSSTSSSAQSSTSLFIETVPEPNSSNQNSSALSATTDKS